MEKSNLTRAQAIAIVGIDAVDAVDAEYCQPTNRVGYNSNDDEVEFSSRVNAIDGGGKASLVAYYYQKTSDVNGCGNLDELTWEVAGYEIR